MCIGGLVMYPLFVSDFKEVWIFWTDFRKYSNIRFHENQCSGIRIFPYGRTNRQTDMT